MTWHLRQLAQQTGRTFVVTGANSGIGLETARALVGRGAHVVLAVRDTAKGERSAAQLAGPGATSVVELDLSDLEQVAGCAKTLLDRHDNLAALICNAGVMGGRSCSPRRASSGRWPPTTSVTPRWSPNCGRSCTPAPLASSWCRAARRAAGSCPRTRLGSSCSTRRRTTASRSTATTKQANLLFAQELHRRCAKAGSPVSAVAVHPGAAATNLFARQLERAGRDRLAAVSKVATTLLLPSAAAGALSTLRALDESTPSGAFVAPSGFTHLRARPELLDIYASAKDPATAARLWTLTEQVLGGPLPV